MTHGQLRKIFPRDPEILPSNVLCEISHIIISCLICTQMFTPPRVLEKFVITGEHLVLISNLNYEWCFLNSTSMHSGRDNSHPSEHSVIILACSLLCNLASYQSPARSHIHRPWNIYIYGDISSFLDVTLSIIPTETPMRFRFNQSLKTIYLFCHNSPISCAILWLLYPPRQSLQGHLFTINLIDSLGWLGGR